MGKTKYIKKLRSSFNNKYELLIVVLLSYSVAGVLLQSIDYDFSRIDLFFVVLFVCGAIYSLKPIGKVISGLVGSYSVIVLIINFIKWFDVYEYTNPSLYFWGSKLYFSKWMVAYRGYIVQVYEFMVHNSLENIQIPTGFIFLISGLIALIFFYIIMYKKNHSMLVVGFILFIIAWFNYVTFVHSYILFYLIGFVLNIFIKERVDDDVINQSKYYKIEKLYSSYILIGTGMLVITVILSLMFPLEKINSKINTYIPETKFLRSDYPSQKTYGYYSLEDSIYQPKGQDLGGSIYSLDDTLLMYVQGENPTPYLRGRVKTTYTGKRWINDHGQYKSKYKANTAGNLISEYKVLPKNLKTITIFSPYGYVKSNFDSQYVYRNIDGILMYKGPKSRNLEVSYKVYYDKNYNEKLPEKLRSVYLQVPNYKMPNAQAVISTKVTSEMSDQEKMKALKDYLTNTNIFEYSLIVQDSNTQNDFVEGFLTTKQGYCTYYASTLAVLGRMAGVPTRYVEGFKLPNSTNSNGVYEVRADRAHAWVEAYIDNEGWVTYEPTPVYQEENKELANQHLDLERSVNFEDIDLKDRETLKDEEYLEPEIEQEYSPENNNSILIILIGLITTLVVISGLIILYRHNKNKKISIYNQTTEKKKIIIAFNQIMIIVTRDHYIIEDGDLEVRFIFNILKDVYNIDLTDDVQELLFKVFYSTEKITSEDLQIIESIYEKFYLEKIERESFIKKLIISYQNPYLLEKQKTKSQLKQSKVTKEKVLK